MKKLYLIGGTMGVGKTTACQLLKHQLHNSVFLDGDWCWDSHPFQVTDETKKIVIDNICYILNNFIHCSCYDHIIFCWVMHQQEIIDEIISKLDLMNVKVIKISLICHKQALIQRLSLDVEKGIRNEDVISRSVERIALYHQLDTIKIDVSDKTVEEVVDNIIKL